MDNESMMSVCVSGFSEQDISDAKTLLFEAVPTGMKKVKRRNGGKKQRDMEDIIEVFRGTDPEKFPIFVARDLYKLPPICFDTVDATHVLKRLLVLQEDVKTIKDTYVTKEMLAKEQLMKQNQHFVDNPSLTSPLVRSNTYREMNVNKNRGASRLSFTMDSGPAGLSPTVNKTVIQPSTHDSIINVEFDSQCVRKNIILEPKEQEISKTDKNGQGQNTPNTGRLSPKHPHPHPLKSPVLSPQTKQQTTKTSMNKNAVHSCKSSAEHSTIAEVLATQGEWKTCKPTDEWIQVNRRRYRNRLDVNTGKAQNKKLGKFKAAELMTPLYISNVHTDTTEEDIIDYIFDNTKEKVKLIQIHMKRNRDYKSFKLWVPKYKTDLFLNDLLWPEGISFRKFVYFKSGDESTAPTLNYNNG